MRLVAALLLAACSCLARNPAAAQLLQLGNDRMALTLTGYARGLAGVHDAGFSLAGEAQGSSFESAVIRLKWEARYGEWWTLRVQNRLQLLHTSREGGSQVAGLGVTVTPARTVDLESTLIDRPRLRAWHDIDRLSLTLKSAAADVTIGRQAVSWGTALLFPVADLWAQFSPFELDTEEKPGIDAVRVLAYPSAGLELDGVLADRGRAADVSAGVRASLSLPQADLYLGAGKFWRELIALGGITLMFPQARLRAELVLPYALEPDELQRARATIGADWIGGRITVSGEYHYNGIGVGRAGDYAAHTADERYRRGESYLLGRHYLGAVAAWQPDVSGRAGVSLTGMRNLQDPSTALVPVLSYDFGQNISVSAGALLTWGATPTLAPLPTLRSEYGAYGDLAFVRMSVFF